MSTAEGALLRSTRRGAPAAALLGAALTAVLLAVTAVVSVARPWEPIGAGDAPMFAFLAVALLVPTSVGAVILRHHPRHPIGVVMAAGPVPVAALMAMETYAYAGTADGLPPPPGANVAAAVSYALWPAFYVWPVAVALLFPDGRLPGPRWRPVAVVALAAPAVVSAGVLVGPAQEGMGRVLQNPFEVPPRVQDLLLPVFWTAWGLMFAGLFAAAAAVVVRFRRARGDERLQLTWLAWSGALIPLGLVACVASYLLFGTVDTFVPVVLLSAGIAVSLSVGIAITRHHLYAIGPIVRGTVVYAILTALLALTATAVALTVGLVAGRGSTWSTAVATVAATAAFQPLRRRVQDRVDRRLAPERWRGVQRMRAFEEAARRGEASPEGVGAALAEALDDPSATLLLRLPETGVLVDAAGRPDDGPAPGRVRTPVRWRGEEAGVVDHAAAAASRPDSVAAVLRAAALPVELARLRAELAAQLDEVRESRSRIVRAGDEERRRLERDLHDGAQQRLVGLGVALRRIQRSLPAEARVLRPAIDQAVGEVGNAITDLRTIAAGLRPPRLDDGLDAALADLARTAPLPVTVEVDAPALPRDAEVAAYYTVCEALTNAVKHAAATHVDVRAVRRDDGRLLVRVADDGAGGAGTGRGTGLVSLVDRIAASGGTLTVTSPPGAGTVVEAEIPCAS